MSSKIEQPPIPQAFADLGVRPSILRALAEASFVTPSEIQTMLIPRALAGVDILGQARTGTGKTAAFAIPILQSCARGLPTQAIIMVPTRELAVQVQAEVERLGKHTPIRSVPVYGGQKILAQMKFLRHGPEILVGTPGRVIDLLDRRIIHFSNIRFVVLDEVDRMLDIGFRDDIRNILSRIRGVAGRQGPPVAPPVNQEAGADEQGTPNPETPNHEMPIHEAPIQGTPIRERGGRQHQTMFVSATISGEIERLARQFMREPIEKLVVPGADARPTVEGVEQWYFSVQPWDKYRLLRMLLEKENPDLAIVFCRTKHGAEKLAKKLHADGIECREIHGNLAQNQREKVMKNFRTGKFDVLIATDLASRGLDVAHIGHIINYDIPEDPEVYIHRVGRTARMGATGKAFTLVSRDQGDELTRVENLINMVIQPATLEGFEPRPDPDRSVGSGMPGGAPAAPTVSRFLRPYGQVGAPAAVAEPVAAAADATSAEAVAVGTTPAPAPATVTAAMPRTLGSKIPVNRRHKRRR